MSAPFLAPAAELAAFAEALLAAGGLSRAHAEQSAAMLVWANLHGVESHGVLRIPRYVEMVELGIIDAAADPRFVHEAGAVAILEAAKAAGAVAMNMASDKAVELARGAGIGWCAARAITHAGAVGYFAQRMAGRGCIGIVMTASKPLMAYHGSRQEGVSTNPLAIAVPGDGTAEPVTLDMSTASVALGKLMAAKDAGRPIPEGWGIDQHGAPTTDPSRVKALLPMAGPKGSGLSLMIEVLCSVLVGHPIVSRALAGEGDPGFNGTALAVDVSAFGDRGAFTSLAGELFARIKELPPAEVAGAIRLPGERGARTASERGRGGIPIVPGTAARLRELAERLSVDVPRSLRQA